GESKWENTGPAIDSAQLPAPQERIGEAVPVTSKLASVTERKIVDPVGIDLMARVKVGNAAKLVGSPSINNRREPGEFSDALGVRTDVKRFGKHVIEIKLQAVKRTAAKNELSSIVAARAYARPRVESGKFRVVEGV